MDSGSIVLQKSDVAKTNGLQTSESASRVTIATVVLSRMVKKGRKALCACNRGMSLVFTNLATLDERDVSPHWPKEGAPPLVPAPVLCTRKYKLLEVFSVLQVHTDRSMIWYLVGAMQLPASLVRIHHCRNGSKPHILIYGSSAHALLCPVRSPLLNISPAFVCCPAQDVDSSDAGVWIFVGDHSTDAPIDLKRHKKYARMTGTGLWLRIRESCVSLISSSWQGF